VDLQRPHHLFLLRPLLGFRRSAWGPNGPWPTKAGAAQPPADRGHPQLAAHIGASLVADEFDMSFFQHRPLDHGCFSPLSMLAPHEPRWPFALVPLAMGVLQFPIPSARRFYKLGQALSARSRAIRTTIFASRSRHRRPLHQVHGERAGFNNTEWDCEFLDLFESDPGDARRHDHRAVRAARRLEGSEVVMWLAMRGALSQR
jgi:gallate dioxygenase